MMKLTLIKSILFLIILRVGNQIEYISEDSSIPEVLKKDIKKAYVDEYTLAKEYKLNLFLQSAN